MAFKKRTFRKKRGNSNFKKMVMKKLVQMKPEIKTADIQYNNVVLTSGAQNSRLLLPIVQGVNASQRIGDKIKATSYYGQFYIQSKSTNPCVVRMIHFYNEDDNTQILNQQETALLVNQLPRDLGYLIKEDKLLSFTEDGTQMRKVIIKGKFKYPHNIRWNGVATIGFHPRMVFMTTSNDTLVNGTMRYYYTDA